TPPGQPAQPGPSPTPSTLSSAIAKSALLASLASGMPWTTTRSRACDVTRFGTVHFQLVPVSSRAIVRHLPPLSVDIWRSTLDTPAPRVHVTVRSSWPRQASPPFGASSATALESEPAQLPATRSYVPAARFATTPSSEPLASKSATTTSLVLSPPLA